MRIKWELRDLHPETTVMTKTEIRRVGRRRVFRRQRKLIFEVVSGGKQEGSIESVSYTHLDVYKRQV